MRKIRTFVSFDSQRDTDCLHDLIVESHQPDSPFEIEDWSLHESLTGDWEKKVSARMHEMELLIVLCGEHTGDAPGVTAELWMAQRARVPYFLLAARPDRPCQKPSGARPNDVVYEWTWANVKSLINGSR